jgi:hypothetical protein
MFSPSSKSLRQLFGLFNVPALGGFIASTEQDNDFFAGIFETNTVTRPIENTHFRYALADWSHIPGIPDGKTLNPHVYSLLCLNIPKP